MKHIYRLYVTHITTQMHLVVHLGRHSNVAIYESIAELPQNIFHVLWSLLYPHYAAQCRTYSENSKLCAKVMAKRFNIKK